MITLRRSDERGHRQHGWLKTYHTFSFADYYDPHFMGFSTLRVINEDLIAPEHGFGFHSHENMEILTWMIDGELKHRDNLGHEEILHANEAQVMSAGTGITHSESNPLPDVSSYLLQIWIEPKHYHQPPRYDQKRFSKDERFDRWQCIASADGADGSLVIQQDARVSLRFLQSTDSFTLPLDVKKSYWLQVIAATFDLNGHTLSAGDAAAISQESCLAFQQVTAPGDVMLFELA